MFTFTESRVTDGGGKTVFAAAFGIQLWRRRRVERRRRRPRSAVAKGAAVADDVHDVPAAPTGAVVRADAVPGRLHQGGARTAAGPHRGQGTGQSVGKAS